MRIINKLAIAYLAVVMASGCSEDFLETAPSNAISEKIAENTTQGLNAILEGIHNMMYMYNFGQRFAYGQAAMNAQLDIMGDDMINTLSGYHMQQYRFTGSRDISSDNGINYKAWDYYYTVILHTNKILGNVDKTPDLTPSDKATILGEAHAFRAWAYHNLVQLFAKRYEKGEANNHLGVIIRTPDKLEEPLPRSTVAEVYNYIDSDMAAALSNLKNAPDKKRKNAIRYSTACGIAARIALTKSDWENAEKYADIAMAESGASLQKGMNLVSGFNNLNDTEWMWAYTQSVDQILGYGGFFSSYSYNFDDGWNDALRFSVNRDIYDLMGEKDVRRKWWVCLDRDDEIPADAFSIYFKGGTSKPNWETTGQSIKFKSRAAKDSRGDIFLMRLAEMYYIKAEAQARQGKYNEAQTTLNTIMVTRDVEYNTTVTGEKLIEEIMRNKRIDLWMEGQRFFDMKRLKEVHNRLNSKNIQQYLTGARKQTAISRNSGNIVENVPTSPDSKYWQFLIPYAELKGNPLIEQNEL
ncbi:RagB/SusD family nutrient uptake outer membrane protein [Capnocytophaga stomatis]|uniref:RagB/SusD family nutrient uptake outer membrane protein n=1 Tax=Capnocytophaga stomatis TaxID=1848904 RepID=UPI00385A5DA4